MVRQCDRAIFEAQVEDERRNNNPPTFHGFAYSGEASDEDDPNDTYYYAGRNMSYTWRSILKGIDVMKKGIIWRVGNRSRINIWSDPWLPREWSIKPITPRGHNVLGVE